MSAELTLYGLSENLLALIDTADMVPDDQREEIEREIIRVQIQVEKKTDSVAGFLRFCADHEKAIAGEIERLKSLKKHYEAAEERLKGYVADIIRAGGKDAKGKYKPLEGRTSTMRLQPNGGPQKLDVYNASLIPPSVSRVTVTMPEEDWDALYETAGMPIIPSMTCKLDPDQALLRAALERGEEVSGARLLPRGESLRVL